MINPNIVEKIEVSDGFRNNVICCRSDETDSTIASILGLSTKPLLLVVKVPNEKWAVITNLDL